MKYLVLLLLVNFAQANDSGHASPATKEASHGAHEAVAGVDPETALKWLKNGNQRFLKKNWRK
jgi:hypothetical protein